MDNGGPHSYRDQRHETRTLFGKRGYGGCLCVCEWGGVDYKGGQGDSGVSRNMRESPDSGGSGGFRNPQHRGIEDPWTFV